MLGVIICLKQPIPGSVFSPGSNNIIFDNCFLFSPPNPIKKFYYRCDRKFHLDDLLKLYEVYDEYAIVLISGKRVELYLHSENQTKKLKCINESLPNQHGTGGQSAQRFERIRNEKIGWYATKISELMTKYYVSNGRFKYKGLIVAGPAEMKKIVKSDPIFIKYFDNFLLKTITIPEITDNSIYQVLNMSEDILTSEVSQTELINFFEKILFDPKQYNLIVFGTNQVLSDFNAGHLKNIYVSNGYPDKDNILKMNTKTKISIIKNNEFVSKYGEIVGIMYYSKPDNFSDNDD